MTHFSTITSFTFGHAVYYASDGAGDSVVLRVYYARNRFRIESRGQRVNPDFRAELAAFARDMLRRKHGVNFAQ